MVSLKVNLNNAQSSCALLMIVDNNRKKCKFANLSYVCMYACELDGHKNLFISGGFYMSVKAEKSKHYILSVKLLI